jgi:DNA-binding PadR family transcriptional regulator
VSQGLSELGRFSEPALLILVSLASGPRHGYGMMADIERISGARLGPGTLYGAIARLERLGLIEPEAADERRRPYRLTGAGGAVLRAELDKLQQLARIGLQRMEPV